MRSGKDACRPAQKKHRGKEGFRMREKLQRFMWGRYGNDKFNQFLMICAMVLLVVSMFLPGPFYLAAVIVMV